MDLSTQINLADPVIRRAFYETGKWSRLIAIISGVFLVLGALVGVGMLLFGFELLEEAFLNNPALAGYSVPYLAVTYSLSIVLGIFVAIKLYLFGKLLKGKGQEVPLDNYDINHAFRHLLDVLKYYTVFSVLSLLGSMVMLFL